LKLSQQTVAILVSDEGRDVLRIAAVGVSDSPSVMLYLHDTDEMGLWVSTEREDGEHLVLIRWECVLSIDVPSSPPETIGFEVQ